MSSAPLWIILRMWIKISKFRKTNHELHGFLLYTCYLSWFHSHSTAWFKSRRRGLRLTAKMHRLELRLEISVLSWFSVPSLHHQVIHYHTHALTHAHPPHMLVSCDTQYILWLSFEWLCVAMDMFHCLAHQAPWSVPFLWQIKSANVAYLLTLTLLLFQTC